MTADPFEIDQRFLGDISATDTDVFALTLPNDLAADQNLGLWFTQGYITTSGSSRSITMSVTDAMGVAIGTYSGVNDVYTRIGGLTAGTYYITVVNDDPDARNYAFFADTLTGTFESEPNEDETAAASLGTVPTSLSGYGAVDEPAVLQDTEDWWSFDIAADMAPGEVLQIETELYGNALATGSVRFELVDDTGAVLDSGSPGATLEAQDLLTGTYYIRAVRTSTAEAYTARYRIISITILVPPPPQDGEICGGTGLPIALQGSTSFSVDTSTFNNDYSAPGCFNYSIGGADVVYTVVVPAGQTVTLEQTGSGSVDSAPWISSDCATLEASCQAGSDNTFDGGTETTSWTNSTAADVTVFLVVDGYFGFGSTNGTVSVVVTVQ
jgi:hypothetical protein